MTSNDMEYASLRYNQLYSDNTHHKRRGAGFRVRGEV